MVLFAENFFNYDSEQHEIEKAIKTKKYIRCDMKRQGKHKWIDSKTLNLILKRY